jgi:large subunit ribosomal protein L24
VPSWLKDAGAVAALPLRLPISSVRLVHPITDEETGVTKDVIIKELKPIRVLPDRPTRTVTWSRVVPGLNITIPWPRVEKPKVDDNACDTLRIDVEERTFIPTLLSPPMPEDLINELRNQYSKFRTRHTPEYIAKKAAEDDEKRAKKEQDKEMLTPVQEFNRMQREIRRARGQPVLTEEMLAKIGEVMARNLNARGERTVHSIPAETVGAKGSETASS